MEVWQEGGGGRKVWMGEVLGTAATVPSVEAASTCVYRLLGLSPKKPLQGSSCKYLQARQGTD